MAKSKVIQRLTDTAEKLYDVRKSIEAVKAERDKIIAPLELERDALQEVLIAELNKNELASIKVKSGDSFTKAIRRSVAVVNEVFALDWAKKNGAVKVDTTLAAQKLKEVETLPEGFSLVQSEYISVRKASKKD